jgi:cystathionine beta-lyase/cystathionine gamma-synthase
MGTNKDNDWKPQTRAVHTGVYKDSAFNSVTTPIYPSSTFDFERLGVTKGFDYTRSGNPTRAALEENLASLEGGVQAWAPGLAVRRPNRKRAPKKAPPQAARSTRKKAIA